MRRRSFFGTLAGGAAAGLSGCIGLSTARSVSETLDESYGISDIDRVDVSTVIGDISITPNDGAHVDVDGVKRAATEGDLRATRLQSTVEEGTLNLEVDTDDVDNQIFGVQIRPEPAIDLDITVPPSIGFNSIASVTGDIDVEAIHGPIQVEGVTGDISLDSIEGDVDVNVTTGTTHVADVDGDVTVEATTGDVLVEHAHGEVSIETTTGDITAEHIEGDLEVSTVTGDIDTYDIDGSIDHV